MVSSKETQPSYQWLFLKKDDSRLECFFSKESCNKKAGPMELVHSYTRQQIWLPSLRQEHGRHYKNRRYGSRSGRVKIFGFLLVCDYVFLS